MDPVFLVAGALALLGAVMMVTRRNPVYSAVWLLVTFLSVAVIFLKLSAPFLAAIHVLVYTGAILVLFLFVIMLLNLGSPDRTVDRLKPQQPIAVLSGLVLAVMIGGVVLAPVTNPAVPRDDTLGTVTSIGTKLFDPALPWLFPFEVTSILLLIAVIGSVVLAKRRL